VVVVPLEEVDPPDTTPPLPVTGFEGEVDGAVVRLTWAPSPEGDLSLYRVYRARANGPEFTLYRNSVFVPRVDDAQVAPGREYAYRVTAVDASGNESAASTTITVRIPHLDDIMVPLDFFSAGAPVPNPSAGPVSLPMVVGSDSPVRISVFDVGGRLVRDFQDRLPAGRGSVSWDGHDASGRLVARGIYFLHVRSPLGTEVRRILIAR
jgi:hypothetical protein